MTITSIKRDFIGDPNIVRIETTDNLAAITATGYLDTQEDAINEINHGNFEWLDGDVALINYSDGEGFFTRNAVTNAFVPEAASGSLSDFLLSTHIFVGSAGNVATGVAMSGDGSITNAGVLEVDGWLGSPLTSATPSAGRLMVGNGTGWTSVAMSGAGTLAASGALSVSATSLTGIVPVTSGGTGTGSVLRQGALIFPDASGIYTEDKTGLYWDDATNRLGINFWPTPALTTALNVNGVISMCDTGTRTYNAGIATEVNASLIEFGINDSSTNRFGGSYTSAAPGGFMRFDVRGGITPLFQFYYRTAGSTGVVAGGPFITDLGNFALSVQNVATTAVNGFPYMPTCPGVPTGVATPHSGLAPFVYDSSGNNFYIYNSGWKHIPTGTGVFTAGSVIFAGAGGVLSQDNSGLFFNSTSNFLGIGTASPNALIQTDNSLANRKIVLFDVNNNDHQFYGLGITSNTFRHQISTTTDSFKIFVGTSTTTSTQLFQVSGLKSVIIGDSAIATTATDGFLYIASCAGAPTGVPTAFTGRVAMVYDSSNNDFYIYSGAWRKVTLT